VIIVNKTISVLFYFAKLQLFLESTKTSCTFLLPLGEFYPNPVVGMRGGDIAIVVARSSLRAIAFAPKLRCAPF
jgi:hypothetical protein